MTIRVEHKVPSIDREVEVARNYTDDCRQSFFEAGDMAAMADGLGWTWHGNCYRISGMGRKGEVCEK